MLNWHLKSDQLSRYKKRLPLGAFLILLMMVMLAGVETHFHEISSGHFPLFQRIVDGGFHLDGGVFGSNNGGSVGVHGVKPLCLFVWD